MLLSFWSLSKVDKKIIYINAYQIIMNYLCVMGTEAHHLGSLSTINNTGVSSISKLLV